LTELKFPRVITPDVNRFGVDVK